MARTTPLHPEHLALGARMTDFAGWDMPLHYGSQVSEHRRVREAAGMFDVSHMGVVEVRGARSRELLRHLLANDVGRLERAGAALYTCMLNPRGGVMDDLIVYFLESGLFRIVVNAGTRGKDLAWMRERAAPFGVDVVERADLAMIAVQGPAARERVYRVLERAQAEAAGQLASFHGVLLGELFVARTGYTGEDGFELMAPAEQAPALWRTLLAQDVQPCGLGARDTLRLEAGLNLYGNDMDETTSPLVSGLAWTVAWAPGERDFVGRNALEAERQRALPSGRAGLVLEGQGVLRRHQMVSVPGLGVGEITSGGFAPTLGRSVALARLPAATAPGTVCQVDIRAKMVPARVVKPPFVHHGKALI
jgi:glycine cleavage system T protein (aminomethyltransferase)